MALPPDILAPRALPITALSKGLALTANGAAISAKVITSTAVPPSNNSAAAATNKTLTHGNSSTINNVINSAVASSANSRYELLLATAGGKIKVASSNPLAPGTAALLKMTAQGLVLTVKPTATGALTATGTSTQQPPATAVTPTQGGPPLARAAAAQQYRANQPAVVPGATAANTAATVSQLIDGGIRQALPLQQSSALLVPLLQQLSATRNIGQPLPAAIKSAIEALLQQLPNAKSLQQLPQLKAAIGNSGIFLEAKLAQLTTPGSAPQRPPAALPATAVTSTTGTAPGAVAAGNKAGNPAGNPVGNVIGPNTIGTGTAKAISRAAKMSQTAAPQPSLQQDFKALGQRLLAAIEPASRPTAPSAGAGFGTIPSAPPLGSIAAQALPTLAPQVLTPEQQSQQSAAREASQNMDIALRQLSRQLLATLAKTQLSQLESLATRASNNPDNAGSSSNWTLEIPIINGRHIDTMELRIDRDEAHNEQQSEGDEDQKLWTVMLDFDLHTLGKMNIQLKILGNTVTATVWSQLEHTHREVKQQLQDLRDKLASVGVEVRQLECKLGSPPPRSTLSQRQLVDITT